jgi:hypothetical protein
VSFVRKCCPDDRNTNILRRLPRQRQDIVAIPDGANLLGLAESRCEHITGDMSAQREKRVLYLPLVIRVEARFQ